MLAACAIVLPLGQCGLRAAELATRTAMRLWLK